MSRHEDRAKERTVVRLALAEPRDAFAVQDTLILALKASETPFPPPDVPYAVQALLDSIAQGLVVAAYDSHRSVVGCLVLDYARWPWVSPRNAAGVYLYNQHFWVEPNHRKGGVAARLIREAQRISDVKNLPLILEISSIDEANGDLRDRFVKMQGFRYTGGKFYRAPRPSSSE